MGAAAAPRLESAIREHLASQLRADRFAGSGRTFRRTAAGWIHVVNVQGSQYGGSFAINLAVHPADISDLRGNTPDTKTITEELCEFRRRMSDSETRHDMWWSHDSTAEGMATAMREAATIYVLNGRKLLETATTEDSDLNTVSPSAFAAGKFDFKGFGSTHCRMAFALARWRRVQGNPGDARGFAELALESVGNASLLRSEIQSFIADMTPNKSLARTREG